MIRVNSMSIKMAILGKGLEVVVKTRSVSSVGTVRTLV